MGRLVLALSTSLLAVVTFVPSEPAQSATGLVAGYAFNEGSGTTAANAAGSGLVGTLTNGATWGAGRNAGAVLLDGADDYVELGNPAALQFTGSMTVSAWVNSAAFPVDDAAIVSKRSSIGYQLDTTIDRGPRTVGFKLTNSSGGSVFRYGATTLQANAWYHVTGVYNAATLELHVYVNGQLDDATLVGTVTSTQRNSTANVNIGRRPTGNGFNFNGRLDDVRIYGRALTLAEIQADMNTPVAGAAGSDTQAPSVSVTSPASNAQVHDIVNVTATASDNVGVAGVQFLVDGANVGVEDADYSVRIGVGYAHGRKRRTHVDRAGARCGGQLDALCCSARERGQLELVPERDPRDRLRPADQHRVPPRRAHAGRGACGQDQSRAAALRPG